MVATPVASPRTSAAGASPPVAAPRRQSSLEITASSEAFETKVLRSQELESAFAGKPFISSAVNHAFYAYIVGRSGSLLDSAPFVLRVAGSNPPIRHVGTLDKSFTRSCLWSFGVKLRHSIRAESRAPLSSSELEEVL